MQTVIGMFDTAAAATRAVEALAAQGFNADRVKMTSVPPQTGGSVGTPATEDGFFGAVGHFFSSIFGADDEERTGTYSEAVRRGSSVVTVDVATDDELDTVSNVLDAEGAVDIDERAEQWKSQGWSGGVAAAIPATANTPSATRVSTADAQGGDVLNVVQEELNVGKRTVQRGGLRVVQRVVETAVNESVSLREEHATIERRPVNRVATAADLTGLQDSTIEVRETAEEAVVAKTARVVEEVVVGKQVTEHTEQINDTVRRTDVEVERFAADTSAAAHASGLSNEHQIAGVQKQSEGEAKASSGSLGQRIEGTVEKAAGNVQEGYGNLKDKLSDNGRPL